MLTWNRNSCKAFVLELSGKYHAITGYGNIAQVNYSIYFLCGRLLLFAENRQKLLNNVECRAVCRDKHSITAELKNHSDNESVKGNDQPEVDRSAARSCASSTSQKRRGKNIKRVTHRKKIVLPSRINWWLILKKQLACLPYGKRNDPYLSQAENILFPSTATPDDCNTSNQSKEPVVPCLIYYSKEL